MLAAHARLQARIHRVAFEQPAQGQLEPAEPGPVQVSQLTDG